MRTGLGIAGRLQGAGTPFELFVALGYGRAPYAAFPAGPWGCTAAAPDGVALGLFGWMDPITQQVSNVKSDGAQLGFVLPTFNMWNWQRVTVKRPANGDCSTPTLLVLRAGNPVVLAIAGDFYTLFPLGGQAGRQVWTDPATGFPYDSDLGGYVATPWTLMQDACGCNARLRISSFASPVVN